MCLSLCWVSATWQQTEQTHDPCSLQCRQERLVTRSYSTVGSVLQTLGLLLTPLFLPLKKHQSKGIITVLNDILFQGLGRGIGNTTVTGFKIQQILKVLNKTSSHCCSPHSLIPLTDNQYYQSCVCKKSCVCCMCPPTPPPPLPFYTNGSILIT